MVEMQLGRRREKFLVDSGATLSAIQTPQGQPTGSKVPIVGATGKSSKQPLFQIDDCKISGETFTHRFALLPECPVNLLGRNLLCKLQARLTFSQDGSFRSKSQAKHVPMGNFLGLSGICGSIRFCGSRDLNAIPC